MDYVNFVFSSILNFQNADIEPSKTCWGELRDESEEELTLLLGADFPDSEYPRSRVDQSAPLQNWILLVVLKTFDSDWSTRLRGYSE